MASEQKDYLEVCFENSWYADFSRLRKLDDDETLVEVKKKIDADGDDLDIFMDSGDAASRYEVEELKDFCRGISLEDVESGIGTAGHRRAVWRDDSGVRRQRLTSTPAKVFQFHFHFQLNCNTTKPPLILTLPISL